MNGKVLRELRMRKGLDVKGLAAASGVSDETISGIESGKRAKVWDTTLIALAKGLGMDPLELERQLKAPDVSVAPVVPHVPASDK